MKIVVYNNKGGCGKSTLTCHVAFSAIERGYPLTVIDADRQNNAMQWLSAHEWDGDESYDVGSIHVTTDIETDDSGLVIVDAPPAFDFVQNFKSADVWIIPVSGRFSVSGAMNVIEEVRLVGRGRIVLVANMCDVNTMIGKTEIEQIRKLNVELFKFPIPRHDTVRKGEMQGVASWQVPYGSRSSAAQNLKLFANWVLGGCNSGGVYGKER